MIINNGPLGKARSKQEPLYNYSGTADPLYKTTRADGTIDWELVLRTSGTLTFTRVVDKVDIFLVGGGANGTAGSASGYSITGGSGGKGGSRRTANAVSVQEGAEYTITVGSAGNDSAFINGNVSYRASGGTGAATSGAKMPDYNHPESTNPAGAASNGGYAFGTASTAYAPGRKYGADGGGGGIYRKRSNGNEDTVAGSGGGTTGGGAGAAASSTSAAGGAATGGTGSGGGGGNAWSRSNGPGAGSTGGGGSGGAGGSGIVIIRNAR